MCIIQLETTNTKINKRMLKLIAKIISVVRHAQNLSYPHETLARNDNTIIVNIISIILYKPYTTLPVPSIIHEKIYIFDVALIRKKKH